MAALDSAKINSSVRLGNRYRRTAIASIRMSRSIASITSLYLEGGVYGTGC